MRKFKSKVNQIMKIGKKIVSDDFDKRCKMKVSKKFTGLFQFVTLFSFKGTVKLSKVKSCFVKISSCIFFHFTKACNGVFILYP